MNLSIPSISTRTCTEAEAMALSLWSASLLPRCQAWAAQRGLQPPPGMIQALQEMRFNLSSTPESMLEELLTLSPRNDQHGSNGEYDRKLEEVAAQLADDLRCLQVQVSHTDLPVGKQAFVTESRSLRRFQRAISQRQLIGIEIVASELIIVTLFSPQRGALYIPHWLIDALPRTLFEPNSSFYRTRQTSLAWLLLDAIVITATNEFNML